MRISKNDLKSTGFRIYSAPYCSMQCLMAYEDRVGYNAGAYGWNWNCYHVGGTNILIVTGYRNLYGRPLRGIREYEAEAEKVMRSCNTDGEEKVKALLRDLLLHQPD